jgi:predicted nuclease of predicted toxin-antitoxin system
VKIRLYLDEDTMDNALIRGLKAHGIDVVSASEAGMVDQFDHEHLSYATSAGRVLVTYNVRDFNRLHAQYQREGRQPAGLIFMPQQRYSIGEKLRRLLRIMAARSAESMVSQVEFLSAWRPE